jgi:hypothetical protein
LVDNEVGGVIGPKRGESHVSPNRSSNPSIFEHGVVVAGQGAVSALAADPDPNVVVDLFPGLNAETLDLAVAPLDAATLVDRERRIELSQ